MRTAFRQTQPPGRGQGHLPKGYRGVVAPRGTGMQWPQQVLLCLPQFHSRKEPWHGAGQGSAGTEGGAPARLKAYTDHLLQPQAKCYPFQFYDKLTFFFNALQLQFPAYSSYFCPHIHVTLLELKSQAKNQSEIGNKCSFCRTRMFCMLLPVKPLEMVHPNKKSSLCCKILTQMKKAMF